MTCPDCTATEVDNHLQHDPTCPLGLDLDRTSDADRRFFADHPGARNYWREIRPSEVADLRRTGVIPNAPGKVAGRVRVTNIADGVRVRGFENVLYLPDLEASK